jgi:hypothetical protein
MYTRSLATIHHSPFIKDDNKAAESTTPIKTGISSHIGINR